MAFKLKQHHHLPNVALNSDVAVALSFNGFQILCRGSETLVELPRSSSVSRMLIMRGSLIRALSSKRSAVIAIILTNFRLCFVVKGCGGTRSSRERELWLCFFFLLGSLLEFSNSFYKFSVQICRNHTHHPCDDIMTQSDTRTKFERSKNKTQKDFEKVMFRCCCFPPCACDGCEQQLTFNISHTPFK